MRTTPGPEPEPEPVGSGAVVRLTLCDAHQNAVNGWLDYFSTRQPAGIILTQIGTPTVRTISEARTRRTNDKAALVRRQIDGLKADCRNGKNCSEETALTLAPIRPSWPSRASTRGPDLSRIDHRRQR